MENIDNVVTAIHEEYCYIPITKIQRMVNCAVDILLSTLYPFDTEKELSDIPQRKESWLIRCVIEQIDRMGMSSAIGYSENGIKVSFDRTQVSQGLIDEIVPIGGIY